MMHSWPGVYDVHGRDKEKPRNEISGALPFCYVWGKTACLQGYLGADAFPGEDLEKERVGDPAVDDVDL